jgi:hypothetical protein
MVNLIKPSGHLDGPLAFLTIWMFGLLHGQKVILVKCFSQITCIFHAPCFQSKRTSPLVNVDILVKLDLMKIHIFL